MITYKKAVALIIPGDIVYSVENGKITEHKVKRIHADSLCVEDGFLYFDEHGYSWWLTKEGAKPGGDHNR